MDQWDKCIENRFGNFEEIQQDATVCTYLFTAKLK
jgi:hypothetical protein